MKNHFPAFAALALSFTGGALVPALKATEWNKETKITINQPIQVQDSVLSPGSYVIKLLDSSSNRRIVQIFDTDENRLITTVLANPAYRNTPLDKGQFKFYESAAGLPAGLHTWFYPGDSTGFEFLLGRRQVEAQSAQRNTNTVAAVTSNN